jgi:transcriptional regulator with XRE-family HTH domain
VTTKESVGSRIKRYREEKGMSATELADAAGISKSYLSELESKAGSEKVPTGEKLYDIAAALGVTMSDLLGRKVITTPDNGAIPASLAELKQRYGVPQADVDMLAQIQFRGDRPRTAERWYFILEAIKGSRGIDRRR